MIHYGDVDGDSGVEAYELGDGFIKVKFKKTGKTYVYTDRSAGGNNILKMKQLAKAGEGLNEFINKHVRKNYDSVE